MRSLLLVFRRGLLKEGYTWGLTSRLRELLIGDMLLMEEAASSKTNAVLLSAMMLGPNVDRKKYSEVMTEYYKELDTATELKKYDLFAEEERRKRDMQIFNKLLKDFRRMEKDGTIAAFEKAVEAKYKQLGIT